MAADGGFSDLSGLVTSALLGVTRTVGDMSKEDLAFHRSSNPSLVPLLEGQKGRLVQLTQGLIKNATSGTEAVAPSMANVDSIEDNWKGVVDVFDNLLEKADACLDEYTGFVRKMSPTREEQIKTASPRPAKPRLGSLHQGQDIMKPQLKFEKLPNNKDETPFKPMISSKPNALISLEHSLVTFTLPDGSIQYVCSPRWKYPAKAWE